MFSFHLSPQSCPPSHVALSHPFPSSRGQNIENPILLPRHPANQEENRGLRCPLCTCGNQAESTKGLEPGLTEGKEVRTEAHITPSENFHHTTENRALSSSPGVHQNHLGISFNSEMGRGHSQGCIQLVPGGAELALLWSLPDDSGVLWHWNSIIYSQSLLHSWGNWGS